MKRFRGFLAKIGDYEIPLNLIQAESFSADVKTLDEDSETDNFGVLHRTVIQRIPIAQFETIAMTEDQLNEFMDNCRVEYEDSDERRAYCSVWVAEYGQYISMDMYMSDMQIKIDHVDTATNTVYYAPFTVKLNGYGE